MNWKAQNLRTKLVFGVAILVAGYVASVGVGYVTGAAQERALAAVGQVSVPVSLKCQSALFEFEASAKEFTDASMTGDESALQAAAATNATTVQIIEAIAKSAAPAGLSGDDLAALRRELVRLDAARAEIFKGTTNSDAAIRDATRAKAEALTAATDLVRQQLTRLSAAAADQLDARLAANTARIRRQLHTNVLLAAVVITLGCATLFLIVQRSIMRPVNRVAASLRESSDRVAGAASTMRESGHRLADGASQQAASLEETGASLEEISSVAKRNADNSGVTKQKVAAACAAADRGAADVGTMRSAMNDIKASADNIAKIVKAIDEIAFQTNILALNAAVEAARAGEAGMGFAVVADEVRNLAQRSAQAARETAALIEDSILKSTRGVEVSARVAAGLDEIGARIREADSLIVEIAAASAEQSNGVSQVNSAVIQLNDLTQKNAAGAEESASAAEEMTAQADVLRTAVRELQALVGAAAAEPTLTLPTAAEALQASRKPMRPDRPSVPARHGAQLAIVPATNGGSPDGPDSFFETA